MIYTSVKESQNKRLPVGWILCESSLEEDAINKPKLVSTDGRRVIGEGRLQRGNKKNRNGRLYDTKDLASQIVCPRSMELIKTGWGMENGHPMSKDLVRQQTIDPNNVVSYLLKIWMDGDFVMGNFKGSNLAIGEAFDQDLRDGLLPAWSLRALGTIENTSRGAEVKGLKIITYDRVYYPSHPEAYTEGILSECAGMDITDSGIYVPKTPNPIADKSMHENGMVVPVMNQEVIDYIQQESCNYKQICNEFEVFYDDITLIEEGTKVQLSNSNTGNVFIVNLETYIRDEIMNYCDSQSY